MNRNQIAIENLKKLRKAKNLTFEQMAEITNKSKSAYERLEKGTVQLTLDEAEQIATALGSDFNLVTNTGMSFNNEQCSVICQGNNPTINVKLDDEQFKILMDKLN